MKTKIGFIGFGEAASLISEGLLSEGKTEIRAFDVNQNHPQHGNNITNKANKLGVLLTDSLKTLINESTIIINATSAKYAIPVAKEARPFLNENKLFVDLNPVSPQVKKEIAHITSELAAFADVSVMESVPNFKHKVPLLVSGNGAKEFEAFGRENGMNIKNVGPVAGSASAIKMIRSVFMKGFTMLLIETLGVSEKFEVTDYILDSLDHSLRDIPLSDTAEGLITRTSAHAERRVAEMEEVIRTLSDTEVDDTMSQATQAKLEMLVEIGLKEHFLNQKPENFQEVIAAIHSGTEDKARK